MSGLDEIWTMGYVKGYVTARRDAGVTKEKIIAELKDDKEVNYEEPGIKRLVNKYF